jgi:hypothetical protein
MTMTIGIAVVAIVVLIALAVYVAVQRRPVAPDPQQRRRAFELEEHVGDLLTGPTHRYGRIFTKYEVWKTDHETRLELVAGPPWKRLNEFARCLVGRYLWQALERIAGAAVVVVDVPTQEWSAETDTHFQDEGWDWLTFPSPWLNGPQYIKE